jgi:hypothetical protein
MPWRSTSDLASLGEPSLGDGYHVPRRVTMEWLPEAREPRKEIEFVVTDEGAVRCSRVTLEATPAGREVRRSDLDLPLEELAEEAVTRAVSWVSEPENGVVSIRMVLDSSDFVAARRRVKAARRPARRRVITDDLLREVADVYRQALVRGEPPTEAVRDHFGKSHRSASGYIERARHAGFLRPAPGRGKAGEMP